MLTFYKEEIINELQTLKRFFEDCMQRPDQDKNIVGQFGAGYSIFFGNAIQYNTFDIPIDAMRLIYKANKEKIDRMLEESSNI